jgi:hypothetical protein
MYPTPFLFRSSCINAVLNTAEYQPVLQPTSKRLFVFVFVLILCWWVSKRLLCGVAFCGLLKWLEAGGGDTYEFMGAWLLVWYGSIPTRPHLMLL